MPSTPVQLSLFWVGTLLLCCTLQVQAQDPVKGSCCKKASPALIRNEITECIILPKTDECVAAVMFFSHKKAFCSSPNARWVRQKRRELEKKGTPCWDQKNNVAM